jgi:hypothetical protein
VTSIYQQVLGSDFARLHPETQRRFALTSEAKMASVGRGIMSEVWRGAFYTLPFLYVGTWRRIMFPEVGRDIPFTIENYAYRDGLGRETVSWVRTFESRRTRRFDAYMIYSEARRMIIDYLGSHQHLAVEIDMRVDDKGGLCLRSGAQRFYEGPIAFTFPQAFTGVAEVREWFDDDSGRHNISVDVRNRRWGRLFGYRGTFDVEYIPTDGTPPVHIRPVREERRD